MPFSARHTIIGAVTVMLGLTILNIHLFRETRQLRAGNRALILRNDSIQSVKLNLEKVLVNADEPVPTGISSIK